ncbi:formate/nitrite transporter [Filimonas lacunae]|uniref:Formate/nitrite transporter n=1 Tax=Filimonas lacunae TaxID=477680 RepID=A0A173MJ01_9BACT|nr:formate/nitrite transporter family protein [Filimonas lacunae]BAV07605.1 nitrite transporter from formate, nitrite family [Filimonas lacunae]SIT29809.1 formate/nitrite transporter [Filimonas lacunae]
MDYKKPAEVVSLMIQSGVDKVKLSPSDLLIRGMLSGAILGFGTTLAITATTQTGLAIVGAAIFPACFVIVVLMGFELVTGSFALLPAAFADGRIRFGEMLKNLLLVFTANLLGGLLYACLFWVSVTSAGHASANAVTAAIIKIAESKTTGYMQYGAAGIVTAFVKGVLCNWMVTMGVVMSLTSTATLGKILAAWLPVFIFFAQGFEHAVVNMFVIPAGMFLGAKVTLADWWLSNQLPVTLGNIAGGVIFTGLALYMTHGKKAGELPASNAS